MNVACGEGATADDGDGEGEAALRTAHCVWTGGLGWRVVWVQGRPTDVVDDYTWQTRTHPQTTRSSDPVATTLPFHPPPAEARDVTSGVVLRASTLAVGAQMNFSSPRESISDPDSTFTLT